MSDTRALGGAEGTAPPRGARTERGARTRTRLLETAEQIFTELGYHEASIVKIAEAAGVAPGTFYLYFAGKQDIFDELVEDLNGRVRRAMADAASRGQTRPEAERLGFEAFFRFTAEQPGLYRVIRQAEFVSPRALRLHYERIVPGYVRGLQEAMARGEIATGDPEVIAWALMGVGEMIGLRWILWGDTDEIPTRVFEETIRFVQRALRAQP
ncbi:MAG: transcriptional regulator, TetR family [Solirubrobacterales bacterium]|nr:transcriptional regulator, TetR family [Solirubrobacterales bacterium]